MFETRPRLHKTQGVHFGLNIAQQRKLIHSFIRPSIHLDWINTFLCIRKPRVDGSSTWTPIVMVLIEYTTEIRSTAVLMDTWPGQQQVVQMDKSVDDAWAKKQKISGNNHSRF